VVQSDGFGVRLTRTAMIPLADDPSCPRNHRAHSGIGSGGASSERRESKRPSNHALVDGTLARRHD
jgi:hypothetical protein